MNRILVRFFARSAGEVTGPKPLYMDNQAYGNTIPSKMKYERISNDLCWSHPSFANFCCCWKEKVKINEKNESEHLKRGCGFFFFSFFLPNSESPFLLFLPLIIGDIYPTDDWSHGSFDCYSFPFAVQNDPHGPSCPWRHDALPDVALREPALKDPQVSACLSSFFFFSFSLMIPCLQSPGSGEGQKRAAPL